MYSFEGKNVLLVGAAGGIGYALAIELAGRSASLALADIDEAGVERAAAAVNQAGGAAIPLRCDVTDMQSLQATVAEAEAFAGDIDVCINCVGVLLSGNPEDIPFQEWERIFAVNLFGAVKLHNLVIPKMLERGRGYIVNTASVAGLYPFAITRLPYAASKAALVSLSENLAVYLKPKGIAVSCLCPGPTVTPIGTSVRAWTEGLTHVGPGSDYALITAPQAATVFCDGMESERVIIPSHDAVTETYLQQHAASPESFIGERINRFLAGDFGLPEIDLSNPDLAAALGQIERNGDR